MEAIYMGEERVVAGIGDVVMVRGGVRAIVIDVTGMFVKVLGIANNMDTGETFVLSPRYIHEYPACDCHYMEKQTLNL